MSQRPDDSGQAQHPAEALLRSTRGDHASTSADRERVRRALARRLAHSARIPEQDVNDVSPASSASVLSPLLKVRLGLVLATAATLATMRYGASLAPTANSVSTQPPAATSAERTPPPSPAPANSESAKLSSDSDSSAQAARTTSEHSALATSARTTRERSARASMSAPHRLGEAQDSIRPLTRQPEASAPTPGNELAASLEGSGRLAERIVSQAASDNRQRGSRAGAADGAMDKQGIHDGRAQQALRAAQKLPPAEQTDSNEDVAKPARQQAARPRATQPLPAAETNHTQDARAPLTAATRSEPPATRRQPSRATAANALPAPDSTTKPDNAELAFLREIQAALQAGEPQEVLDLSQQHARRWPHGIFVQEREGLRAIAACQAHTPDAISGARKFSAIYPRSPMLTRVRAACQPPSAAKTAP